MPITPEVAYALAAPYLARAGCDLCALHAAVRCGMPGCRRIATRAVGSRRKGAGRWPLCATHAMGFYAAEGRTRGTFRSDGSSWDRMPRQHGVDLDLLPARETEDGAEGPDVEEILRLVRALPPRERIAVELHTGLCGGVAYTLDELGRVLGVSRERVRQIEAQAYRRIHDEISRRRLAGE